MWTFGDVERSLLHVILKYQPELNESLGRVRFPPLLLLHRRQLLRRSQQQDRASAKAHGHFSRTKPQTRLFFLSIFTERSRTHARQGRAPRAILPNRALAETGPIGKDRESHARAKMIKFREGFCLGVNCLAGKVYRGTIGSLHFLLKYNEDVSRLAGFFLRVPGGRVVLQAKQSIWWRFRKACGEARIR